MFYFNLSDDIYTKDEEGRDLAGMSAARQHAEANARTMAAESVRLGVLNLSHYIEVTNKAGEPLFKVTFGDVVTVAP